MAKETLTTKSRKKNPSAGSETPQDVEASNAPREDMIAVAAYYLAERRHFQGGDPVRDWLEAESEIDHLLSDDLLH